MKTVRPDNLSHILALLNLFVAERSPIMDEVTVTKVIVTFLLWASKFACGVAPILMRGNMRGPNGGWWAKKLIGKTRKYQRIGF